MPRILNTSSHIPLTGLHPQVLGTRYPQVRSPGLKHQHGLRTLSVYSPTLNIIEDPPFIEDPDLGMLEDQCGTGYYGDDEDQEEEEDDPETYRVDSPVDKRSPLTDSPVDNQPLLNEVLSRAAEHFHIDTQGAQEERDFSEELVGERRPVAQTIPILKSIQRRIDPSLVNPNLTRAVNPRIEKLFRAAQSDPLYISGQLNPHSLVVANTRKRAGTPLSLSEAPPDKESKKIYGLGRKVASTSAYQARITNSTTLLASYNCHQWEEVAELIDSASKPLKSQLVWVASEGRSVSGCILKATFDAADNAGRLIAESTIIQRHAWLRQSGFKPETQTSLIDKPVETDLLFGKAVEDVLKNAKDEYETLIPGPINQQTPQSEWEWQFSSPTRPKFPERIQLFPEAGFPMEQQPAVYPGLWQGQ
ncbi:uncharacterized protein [Ambystoma mexicanum]|uniref:uncharacterized protein n=1 Tax=Ambystoma mexicanum TaxID=8296 RepID=UPI0037E7A9FE